MTGGVPVVLVVDADPETRRSTNQTLNRCGYGVLEASNASQGLELAARHRPDLVVVDLALPDSNGPELVRRMRQWSHVPIVVVATAWAEADAKAAMEHGASAPIVRPFRVADFTKTVRALLRSRPASDESSRGILDLGGEILIDLPARKVTVRGRAVHLTPNEFKLLAVLVEHAGAIVPYDRLLTAVWGPAHTQQVQSLRVHMTQLRHKLEQKPSRPKYLSTEIGLGYGLRAR